MALTYSTYLRIEELLSLQHPQSQGKAHDRRNGSRARDSHAGPFNSF